MTPIEDVIRDYWPLIVIIAGIVAMFIRAEELAKFNKQHIDNIDAAIKDMIKNREADRERTERQLSSERQSMQLALDKMNQELGTIRAYIMNEHGQAH